MNAKKIFILIIYLGLITGCQQEVFSQNEREKLFKAFESKDSRISVKAILEIGRTLENDLNSKQAMIKFVFSSKSSFDTDPMPVFVIAKVFSRLKTPPISELIDAYRSTEVPEEDLHLKKLLIVLGRIGPKAKDAIPFLLEELAKQTKDPNSAGYIRVVLANIGYKSEENIATILSDLTNHSKRGKDELEMMSFAGAGNWVDDKIIGELVKLLYAEENDLSKMTDEQSMESVYAAIALGSLGERAVACKNSLNKLMNYALTEDPHYEHSSVRIIYCLSMVKVSPNQSDKNKALMSLINFMGTDFGNHTDYAAACFADILIDDDIIKRAARCLREGDPHLVQGALRMLLWVGLEGQEYAPDVMKIIKDNPFENSRKLAAEAIGYVGYEKDIPQLENILKKEKDYFVQAQIKESISILRLEPTEE
jgi:HEAT repeat protein